MRVVAVTAAAMSSIRRPGGAPRRRSSSRRATDGVRRWSAGGRARHGTRVCGRASSPARPPHPPHAVSTSRSAVAPIAAALERKGGRARSLRRAGSGLSARSGDTPKRGERRARRPWRWEQAVAPPLQRRRARGEICDDPLTIRLRDRTTTGIPTGGVAVTSTKIPPGLSLKSTTATAPASSAWRTLDGAARSRPRHRRGAQASRRERRAGVVSRPHRRDARAVRHLHWARVARQDARERDGPGFRGQREGGKVDVRVVERGDADHVGATPRRREWRETPRLPVLPAAATTTTPRWTGTVRGARGWILRLTTGTRRRCSRLTTCIPSSSACSIAARMMSAVVSPKQPKTR